MIRSKPLSVATRFFSGMLYEQRPKKPAPSLAAPKKRRRHPVPKSRLTLPDAGQQIGSIRVWRDPSPQPTETESRTCDEQNGAATAGPKGLGVNPK